MSFEQIIRKIGEVRKSRDFGFISENLVKISEDICELQDKLTDAEKLTNAENEILELKKDMKQAENRSKKEIEKYKLKLILAEQNQQEPNKK